MTLWQPLSHQVEVLQANAREILVHGSRGSGKTELGIAWLLYDIENPGANRLVLRKNYSDILYWIDKAEPIYRSYGAKLTLSPYAIFEFPSGAQIRLGHLADEKSWSNYLSHEYDKILIEELTEIAKEDTVQKVLGSLRNTSGLKSQFLATTNSIGVGRNWVKKRWKIGDKQPGEEWNYNEGILDIDGCPLEPSYRIHFASNVDENIHLIAKDPEYVRSLDALKITNPILYKSWRLGDWNVTDGTCFPEFISIAGAVHSHVLKATVIPTKAEKFIGGLDWGYSKESAFSFHLAALVEQTLMTSGDKINRCIVMKCFYGNQQTPSEVAHRVCDYILADYRLKDQSFQVVYDSAMGATDQLGQEGMIKIFKDIFRGRGVNCEFFASKKGTGALLEQTNMLHQWLSVAPDGMPYLVFAPDCTDSIREFSEIMIDPDKPEIFDTRGSDHSIQGTAYSLQKATFRPSDGLGGSIEESSFNSSPSTLPMNLTNLTEALAGDSVESEYE